MLDISACQMSYDRLNSLGFGVTELNGCQNVIVYSTWSVTQFKTTQKGSFITQTLSRKNIRTWNLPQI